MHQTSLKCRIVIGRMRYMMFYDAKSIPVFYFWKHYFSFGINTTP